MDTNRKIKELLTKTEHYDADERFMATNDLIRELAQVSGTLDASLQMPVRNAVLKLLDDKGKDVSTIAVKCLSTLVLKFDAEQVTAVVDKLATVAVDGKTEEGSRDTMCDGIRNVIAVIDVNVGKTFATPLLTTLMKGLRSNEHTVEMLCMDVIKDLLEKYGGEVQALLPDLLSGLTNLLGSDNDAVSKRASVTLGPLVPFLEEKEFNSLMINVIIKNIEGRKPDVYIQCVGVTSKAAGTRVGEYLPKIVPPLERFCKKEAATPAATVELWQNCLKAFEFIITRCPNQVTAYVPGIVDLALAMLSYDPNVVKDAPEVAFHVADAGDDWGDDGGEGWGDDSGKGGWGDAADDVVEANAADESWKVRLAAAGVLSAFIRCRSDILKNYYVSVCEALISRYTVERDGSVCEELLLATKELCREAIVSTTSANKQHAEDGDDDMPMPQFVRTRSSYETLENKVTDIVAGICKIFPKATIGVQKAALGVLSELCTVRRGDLQDYFEQIMPHILFGVQGTAKASALNNDALVLLRLTLSFHAAALIKPYLGAITAATVASISTADVQIKPEALKVAAAIAKLIPREKDSEAMVQSLYKTTLSQLVVKDASQATKTASIHTMAVILANFGGSLPAAVKEVLPVYHDRLGNEVSRESTLRAITKIANAETKFDLSYIVQSSTKEICTFMRQASPKVRHQTAKCLEALIRTHASKVSSADFQLILAEVSTHIEENDLFLAHLVLDLISTSLQAAPAVANQVATEILPRTIRFLQSPLVQGDSLRSLIKFFKSCAYGSKVAALNFDNLLKTLLGVLSENSSKTTFAAVSQCVAGMTVQDDKKVAPTVTQFLGNIKGNAADHVKQISLLTVGEIGRAHDLSGHAGIEGVVSSAFSNKSGDVQKAAAFALGTIAVGNLPKFLPILLTYVTNSPDQYLVLSALKEAIGTRSTPAQVKAFAPFLGTMTPLLFARGEAKDEGTRAMAAECLGRLAVIDVTNTIPALSQLTTSQSELARQTAVTALRFAFSPELDWQPVSQNLLHFAKLLKDPSLIVRQQAVLSFNSLFNSNIGAISTELLNDTIIPALYAETKVHPELVHLVDYGNFKENVDDGLPLRKSLFMCLSSLLENGSERLDMQLFMKQLVGGLTDNDDIQIISLQMFETIARTQPRPLLEILDSLPATIMDSVKSHLKIAKTPEGERSMDCLRAIVKAVTVFNKVPGHEMCSKFNMFYKQILATQLLKDILTKQQAGQP